MIAWVKKRSAKLERDIFVTVGFYREKREILISMTLWDNNLLIDYSNDILSPVWVRVPRPSLVGSAGLPIYNVR
ncbi:hypothetical protein QQG55_7730 [Brugia pahangi]